MKENSHRRKKGARGSGAFTLVEVLVAEAVFLILMLVVVQLIFGVIQTAATQKKRMDSLDDARQSLDRLSLDWSARARRYDVLGDFARQTASSTNAANAQIGFLSQVQAYSGLRHLSWVSYGINNITQVNQGSQSTITPALTRGILGYNWSTSDPTGGANPLLSFPAGNTAPSGTPTVDPLATTVFRVEYCFLQQVPTVSTATTTSAFTTNSLNLTSSSLVGVVVAVAALDQQSRQVLTQAQLISLGNALPSVADGQSPQAAWATNIDNGAFATAVAPAGVPLSVANAVRVFQRILYINE